MSGPATAVFAKAAITFFDASDRPTDWSIILMRRENPALPVSESRKLCEEVPSAGQIGRAHV